MFWNNVPNRRCHMLKFRIMKLKVNEPVLCEMCMFKKWTENEHKKWTQENDFRYFVPDKFLVTVKFCYEKGMYGTRKISLLWYAVFINLSMEKWEELWTFLTFWYSLYSSVTTDKFCQFEGFWFVSSFNLFYITSFDSSFYTNFNIWI